MKKYVFQILAICVLCFSFTTSQAQCDHCYDQAVENFNELLPFNEGEDLCESVARDELKAAKKKFDDAKALGDKQAIDHAGYALAHNIINYMSMMNSCYDECGSPGCSASVETANEMSDCLKKCESPYADALCKTAAYIECQCDCDCDNWWEAECKDDPCAEVECNCLFVLFSGTSLTNEDGCCEVSISMRAPECCETTLAPHYDFSSTVTPICDVDFDQNEDKTEVVITICCPEALEEGTTVQVNTTGDCEVQSQPFKLGGCAN